MDLQCVPILTDNFHLPSTVEDMVIYADGKSVLNPVTNREGVVVRSKDSTISFKAISNTFLLEEK
jgi:hypothetical protein